MQVFYDVLVFSLQVLVVVCGIIAVLIAFAATFGRMQAKPELEIDLLDKKWRNVEDLIQSVTLDKKEIKERQKAEKAKSKAAAKSEVKKNRLFVLDFVGDIKASAVEELREEISAIILAAKPEDQVLVKIESPGGMVHGYGLAASQLLRLKQAKIHLVASVDKVAASGGYLMACVADRVIAAPFAIVGSIGVVAQVPNVHRLLKKYDVDYQEYTAGEYKRTVSLLGEITPKGEEKFKEQLEETHQLFKHFVSRFRSHVNLEKIATGEHWYGEHALGLGLVDEISTSDDFLLVAAKSKTVVKLKFEKKQKLSQKLSNLIAVSFHGGLKKVLEQWQQDSRFH